MKQFFIKDLSTTQIEGGLERGHSGTMEGVKDYRLCSRSSVYEFSRAGSGKRSRLVAKTILKEDYSQLNASEASVLRKAMRIIGVVMLFAISAYAQIPSVAATAACGSEKVSFDVKLDESQHAVAQPEPGKATVYFIQEKGADALGVTTNIGLDGTWVGANKDSSYFAVSVEPGEHHVCANVRSHRGHPVRFMHFTAETGRIYYFDARIVYGEEAEANLFFGEVDGDQAKYLIASFPLSVSNLKK